MLFSVMLCHAVNVNQWAFLIKFASNEIGSIRRFIVRISLDRKRMNVLNIPFNMLFWHNAVANEAFLIANWQLAAFNWCFIIYIYVFPIGHDLSTLIATVYAIADRRIVTSEKVVHIAVIALLRHFCLIFK